MTHDELLEDINKEIKDIAFTKFVNPLRYLQALRAVVELHTPWDYTFPNAGKISYCSGCPNDSENGQPEWPCDTIQIIEKELA